MVFRFISLIVVANLGVAQQRLDTYDLRGLVAVDDERRPRLRLPGLWPKGVFELDDEAADPLAAFAAPLDQAALSGLIEHHWNESPPPPLRLRSSRLRLFASESVHRDVRGVVRAIESDLHVPLDVSLHVFSAADVDTGDGAVLDREQLDRVLERHVPERTVRGRLRAHVPAELRAGRSVRFIRDYDVEVTSGVTIYDPKVAAIDEGLHVGLMVTLQADGRLAVVAGVRDAELTRLKLRDLEVEDMGKLHDIRIRGTSFVSTAVVEDGGGLLLRGGVDEPRAYALRFEVAERLARSEACQAWTLSPMFGPSLRLPPFAASVAARIADPWGVRPLHDGPAPFDDDDRILVGEYLDDRMAGRFYGDDLHCDFVGPCLFARGSRADREAIDRSLRQLAAALRARSLELRAGRVPNQLADGLRSGQPATELVAVLELSARVATLPDNHFAVVGGAERSYVADYDVEISSEAAGPNPVIGMRFSGFAIDGYLAEVASTGRARLTGAALFAAEPDVVPLAVGGARLGTIDSVQQRVVHGAIDTTLAADGGWQVLWTRPFGDGETFVVAARLR